MRRPAGKLREHDGRHQRSERTKTAVADALISLLNEGDLRPTAQRIAERAGVSLRIVFHHFKDLNELFTLVSERQLALVLSNFKHIGPEGPVTDRLRRFVVQRTRLLEQITQLWRAAARMEPMSKVVEEQLQAARAMKRQSVANVFAPELEALPPDERSDATIALGSATGFDFWRTLRAHQGLSIPEGRRVVVRLIASLLHVPVTDFPWHELEEGAEP